MDPKNSREQTTLIEFPSHFASRQHLRKFAESRIASTRTILLRFSSVICGVGS